MIRTAAIAGLLTVARAQCLDWRTFPYTGTNPEYTSDFALQVHDDGSGPALYVAQHEFGTPGPSFATVRRWNGSSLSPVGNLDGDVDALATFDDGTGPALYAGGSLFIPGGGGSGTVAKWNGSVWQILPPHFGDHVYSMCVHDDGTGPALYTGALYSQFQGTPIVSKWDGAAWTPIAGGVGSGYALALASYDDGNGPALYVGGHFQPPSGTSSSNIARWRSGAWTGLAGGTNPSSVVLSLATFDDGSGPALYAGGSFQSPIPGIARWNGTAWSQVGAGIPEGVGALATLDLGSGLELYAGRLGPRSGVSRWDGTAWTDLGPENTGHCLAVGSFIRALAAYDEGNGPRLFAASEPESLGFVGSSLARWNTSAWEPVDQPGFQGLHGGSVYALHEFDLGSGPELIVGGDFCGADGLSIPGVARHSTAGWSPIGRGLDSYAPVRALASYDSGAGPELFAGQRGIIVRWSGTDWFNLGGGTSAIDSVFALQQFGADLYLGGVFTILGGNVATPNIGRWNGSAFAPVGIGSSAGVNGAVNALTTFDDGTGLALYAAGSFTVSNSGVQLNRIGRWNGTSWSPLGSGMDALVDALVVFDDGTGPALYAGGTFTVAGGTAANRVARWNGTSWSALGAGLSAQVLSLGVFDDGWGPALYAGGNFTPGPGSSANRIARWNGLSWSTLGGGVDGSVWAMRSFDDGSSSGPQLFVGGSFHHAVGEPSDLIAAWRGCAGPISRFCFGDGSVAACPCGNQGLHSRGCDNSAHTGGARLNATGTTSPDTIQLYAAGELPNAPTLVFQGNNALISPTGLGDGLRCVVGNTRRMYVVTAVSGTITVPPTGQPSLSARSAALGDPLSPGDVRTYQAWYRDPSPSFCGSPSQTFNLSNAVRIVW